MNYEFTANLLFAGVCFACLTWVILAAILLNAAFKRNWILATRILKYILNTVVYIIALGFVFELAMIVRPEIYATKEESSTELKLWIQSYQIDNVHIALLVISLLFAFNLLIHIKVDHRRNSIDLIILTAFDAFVLFFGIWLTGQSAYYGLMQEINRHFDSF